MAETVSLSSPQATIQVIQGADMDASVQESARPQRKSVAFSEGATVVDSNGNMTEVNGHSNQTSAENHTKGKSAGLPIDIMVAEKS